MKMRKNLAALLLPLALPAVTLANPQAVTAADGSYIGFNGISVQGTLYDVRFVEGTFNGLFGGVPQFALESQASAAAFGLYQAIATVPALDAEPFRMAGCGLPGTVSCQILSSDAEFSSLPSDVDVIAVRNGREASSVLNGMSAFSFATDFNTSNDNTGPGGVNGYVWARWTVAAPVPEPASCAMMALGLGALLLRRRRAG
jgi:hypothetical protein